MVVFKKNHYSEFSQESHYTENHREVTENHREIFAISLFRYFSFFVTLLLCYSVRPSPASWNWCEENRGIPTGTRYKRAPAKSFRDFTISLFYVTRHQTPLPLGGGAGGGVHSVTPSPASWNLREENRGMSVKNFGLSEERSDEFPKFSERRWFLVNFVQREKEFSFVISFDPAKEITFCSKVKCSHKNIAMLSKMRTKMKETCHSLRLIQDKIIRHLGKKRKGVNSDALSWIG